MKSYFYVIFLIFHQPKFNATVEAMLAAIAAMNPVLPSQREDMKYIV